MAPPKCVKMNSRNAGRLRMSLCDGLILRAEIGLEVLDTWPATKAACRQSTELLSSDGIERNFQEGL